MTYFIIMICNNNNDDNRHNMICKWGQNLQKLYITFQIGTNESVSWSIVDGVFKVTVNGVETSFGLFAAVGDVRVVTSLPHIIKIVVDKCEEDEWTRLANDKVKRGWLQIDWDHWMCENSEEDHTGGIDMSTLNLPQRDDDGDDNIYDDEENDGENDEENDGENDEEHDGENDEEQDGENDEKNNGENDKKNNGENDGENDGENNGENCEKNNGENCEKNNGENGEKNDGEK